MYVLFKTILFIIFPCPMQHKKYGKILELVCYERKLQNLRLKIDMILINYLNFCCKVPIITSGGSWLGRQDDRTPYLKLKGRKIGIVFLNSLV